MKVWLNGSLVSEAEARVSVFNHGLTVGDGVFETFEATGGRPFAVRRHLDRLAVSAGGMGSGPAGGGGLRAALGEVVGGQPAGRRPAAHHRHRGPSPLGSDRGAVGTPR